MYTATIQILSIDISYVTQLVILVIIYLLKTDGFMIKFAVLLGMKRYSLLKILKRKLNKLGLK